MVRIRDTLLRDTVELTTREPGKLSMYVCGPTVYDMPHVGHGRTAVVFDMIRRYLEWTGLDVTLREQHHRRRGQDHRPRRRARDDRARAGGASSRTSYFDAHAPARHRTTPINAARHRVHRRHAGAGRRARRPRPRLRGRGAGRVLRRSNVPRATARCRTARSRSCASRPARASTSTRRSAAPWTSRCGRRPSRASPRGTRRGARVGRAGTSSARRCRSTCWATGSTSTAAATTSRSRTTRTSGRRPRAAGHPFARHWVHSGMVHDRRREDVEVARQLHHARRGARPTHELARGAARDAADRTTAAPSISVRRSSRPRRRASSGSTSLLRPAPRARRPTTRRSTNRDDRRVPGRDGRRLRHRRVRWR